MTRPVSQPQTLHVTAEWRRKLRVWLASNDLTATAVATTAAHALLECDHGATVYVPPPTGAHRITFSIPEELHRRVIAETTSNGPNALWTHGIRTIRDFYLVALDNHIAADTATADTQPTTAH
ncbi:hypothetical protein AAFP30_27950 [Gordonia sp. CPCC 205515]|uniref:hypothetical protein n=1 Tax=Gordonia sp. CPCC 205515 TaxID=3140791 RepID=UPI003AF3451B